LLSVLEIEFKNRSIYQYRNVPENIYKRLMNSSSKGTYLSENIKDKYSYVKVR